jgi:dihydrofolate reductase
MIKLIVAYCNNRGIGYKNSIPWNHPTDMKYFSQITKGNGNNAIIMGANTYRSIGRTLPNRHNIILSTTLKDPSITIFTSLEAAIQSCNSLNIETIWIIGGEKVYKEVLEKELADEIHISEINEDYECDAFFAELSSLYTLSEKKVLTETININIFNRS